MNYEFLKPVSANLLVYLSDLPVNTVGEKLLLHTPDHFPDLEGIQLALITVNDSRGLNAKGDKVNFDAFRKNWYGLFPGNWSAIMADLGTIDAGETLNDTYFVVKSIVADLLHKNILPVIIGGSQDLTYAIYRAYDRLEQMVNLVAVDSKIDVVSDVINPSESFLTKIIMEEPNNLLNYANIGYQTYYNSQEEIDLIDKLYFESYRLGEVASNIALAEPILRDADIVSVDIHAVKSADMGYFSKFNPNGFDGREICALARYSGLSDKVSSFGIFNIDTISAESLLITQILWYFVEGFNFRVNEYPYISKKTYFKYNVLLDDQELVFYKSDVSDRWWIEIDQAIYKEGGRKVLFPCSYEDYISATNQVIPERWWKAIKKMID
ncbi:formimidoylglutamase [Myroides ceti]|uniref:Formimidoylglutamase n=1 Tax=Paenimyroides ceti TaxID=395087 RepID=A0ABT8CUY5_9FLAO|nr:formimidoylglutamase [Paenimyroides ceti]MDN3708302.1 formimidoylglutamase [Paenimyroides ceti]MDN3709088.1 formimidoylglutamase [Paenimyroides ceti]